MSQSPVPITTGSGAASVAAELVGNTSWQQIEVYGGGGASVMAVNPDGSIKVSVLALQGASVSGTVIVNAINNPLPAGTNLIGNIGGSVVGFQGGSWTTSVVGGPITLYAPTTSFVSGVTSVITSTSSVQVLAPASGGQRNYITQVLVTNAAAVATTVQLFDGGNVIHTGFAAASGGGWAASFPTPLRQSSIAGNLSALSTVQASIFVSASGYTAP